MKRTQFCAVTAVLVSAACVMMPPDSESTDAGAVGQQKDGGVEPPAPAVGPTEVIGEGVTFDPALLPVPPTASPDDPAGCLREVVPVPDLNPQPDRPCTVTVSGSGTTEYRYDSTGRVIYWGHPGTAGSTYTSEDRNGVRLEKVTVVGRVSTWDVTQLLGGKPAEADHYTAVADGGLVLTGHSSWLYDDQGRQEYVVSRVDVDNDTRLVDRNVYDAKGRPYFVDRTQYSAAARRVIQHRYTARSWFANGTLAHEIQACDVEGGAPCGVVEKRWEPCGNLAYSGNLTGNGRQSSFTDWTWASDGRSLVRHDRWNTTGPDFNSTESYQTDSGTQVKSGTILITNPPEYTGLPPTEEHRASYTYDAAGRLSDRVLDGKPVFHARFDDAGKVLEVTTNDTSTTRWTYDGCGR